MELQQEMILVAATANTRKVLAESIAIISLLEVNDSP